MSNCHQIIIVGEHPAGFDIRDLPVGILNIARASGLEPDLTEELLKARFCTQGVELGRESEPSDFSGMLSEPELQVG
jgi:hypothetical protein